MHNMATSVLVPTASRVRSAATVIPTLARMVIMAPDLVARDPVAPAHVIADPVDQASAPVPDQALMVIEAAIVDMMTVIPATMGIRRTMNKPRTNLG
jgi:hypothetical protein